MIQLASTVIVASFSILLLGAPLLLTLLAATLVVFLIFYPYLDPVIVIQQMIGGIKPSALIAVPLFILAAEIMTRGRSSLSLLNLVESFLGHLKGGLPITTAMTCTLFGAVSGSTQSTVVAVGSPLRPRLIEKGYPDSFATALIINASDIALLIPPSIGLIVYGVVSGTSIGELFIAGIVPGLLILLAFSLYSIFISHKLSIPTQKKFSWKQRYEAFKKAFFALGFPLIIVGGIYGGIFSPTEAAAISVLYAFILECLVFRELSLKDLYELGLSTATTTAVVFILVGAGAAFSWLMSYIQFPQIFIEDYMGLTSQSGELTILLAMCAAYFIGCMFVDPIVVILILTPIFHPIALGAGLDPVHVGILVTLQAAIGSATPPFGCDIFTAVAIFRKPYLEIIRGTPPFILILILITFLLIAFPFLSLFLRDLAF